MTKVKKIVEIEKFDRGQFESTLANFCRSNQCAALKRVADRDGQICYLVTPFKGFPVGLHVWSSMDPTTGRSEADAGGDSIRAVCCKIEKANEGCTVTPWGGKSVRWIDRRKGGKGWSGRLHEALAVLLCQVAHLKARPTCPHCDSPLVPLTTKQGDNKGKGFIACTFAKCPNKAGRAFGFFQWADEMPANGPSIAPAASEPVKPTPGSNGNPQASGGAVAHRSIPCDKCGKVCRVMTAGPTTKNAGRLFISCDEKRGGCGRFTFVTEEDIAGCTVSSPSPPGACMTMPLRSHAAAYVKSALARLDEISAGGQYPDEAEAAADDLRRALELLR